MRVRNSYRVIVLAAAAVLLVAACADTVTPAPTVDVTPSAVPTVAGPTPTPFPTEAPSPTDSGAPTPTPTPNPSAPVAACAVANLVARITSWEGAMGHQIAHVELTNNGPACRLPVLAQPQLVEGSGAVLINGTAPALALGTLFGTGQVRKTLVQDGDYCGPVPTAPVTVAFVFPDGGGRIVAQPVSATDVTGVPGCLSGPGSAGRVEMQEWAP